MPLNVQDTLKQAELARLFQIAAKTGEVTGTAHLRHCLSVSGAELARVLLEVIPPDSLYRAEALDHLKRVALLTSVALAGLERIERREDCAVVVDCATEASKGCLGDAGPKASE